MTRPGVVRYLLDRYATFLHRKLTQFGTLPSPPELDAVNLYLRTLHADIEQEIRNKTYIPVSAKEFAAGALAADEGPDPFRRPIQQGIRQIIGSAQGGDSASAQIAAVNRKSRVVRNILKTLLAADEPLILLGDPGTGKTMTLQQAAMALAADEAGKVFPVVTVYVRLGEFWVDGRVGPREVADYVKRSAKPEVRPYLDGLDRAGRLVILFDGMDEMSRDRYSEHTEALSVFAGSRRGVTRTLFSCRITDFSPKFIHQRLVLLPFNLDQIGGFLKEHVDGFPLVIDGEPWTRKRLARRLARGDLPMEANNPFVLWLLCAYLRGRKTWPSSRVEMLGFYNELNYERKAAEAPDDGPRFPPRQTAFAEWGRFAYTITALNRGSVVHVSQLGDGDDPDAAARVKELVRLGKLCGVLAEATDGPEHLVRFEHHRFQEFFTAYYIHHTRREVTWLGKLDVPRWQETIVNLILMGGADDATRALADSILEPVKRYRETHPADDDAKGDEPGEKGAGREGRAEAQAGVADDETIAADRVELVSRILRQVGSAASTVRETLLPPFEQAVNHLTDHGNPITQVKMIRACQNVPGFDFIHVLQKSLKSPINWVRTQALIIIASGDRSARAVGSNFATEMGFDLANGLFPARLPAYARAALASSSIRYWACLASGVFCYLLYILLLLGLSALIFRVGVELFARFELVPWFPDARSVAAYATLLLVTIAVTLKYKPQLVWVTIPSVSAGSLAVLALVTVGWNSSISKLFEVIMPCFLLVVTARTVFAVIGIGFHSTALALFFALNPRLKSPGHTLGSLWRAAWRGGEYERFIELGIIMMFGFLFLLVVLMNTLLPYLFLHVILPAGMWLGRIIPLPFDPLLNSALVVLGPPVLVALIKLVRKLRLADYLDMAAKLIGFIVLVGLGGIILGGVASLSVWVGGTVFPELTGAELGALATRSLIILLLVALAAAFVYSLSLVMRELMRLAWGRGQMFPPDSIRPDVWKRRLAEANAVQQDKILLKTNHQSVGLKADEFLLLLKEVEPLIKADPALSTYWSQRDQLEQVLRQERAG